MGGASFWYNRVAGIAVRMSALNIVAEAPEGTTAISAMVVDAFGGFALGELIMNGTPEQRFWAKVDKDGPPWNGTPCWLWTGCKNPRGYGRFWLGTRMEAAHRVAYIWRYGTIPSHLETDHLCRNTSCVNPAHHSQVTHKENVDRGFAGFHMKVKSRQQTHCKQEHLYTERNTMYRRDGTRNCRACS
ncbi:hypothetical protein LCGC14_3029530, partial [marine sediment metagenome]